jgi:hypothetical protein
MSRFDDVIWVYLLNPLQLYCIDTGTGHLITLARLAHQDEIGSSHWERGRLARPGYPVRPFHRRGCHRRSAAVSTAPGALVTTHRKATTPRGMITRGGRDRPRSQYTQVHLG